MTDEQVERVAVAIRNHVNLHDGPTRFEDIARAAIEAMQPEWQPIETAPKDGRRIVAMRNEQGKDLPSFIHWDEEDGWCGMTSNDEKRVSLYQPTDWMPLPPPTAGDKP